MYSITIEKFGRFDLYNLTNTKTGECLSIIPAFGGLCHAWTVPTGKGLYQLLDNYENADQLEEMVDRSFKGVKLIPYPNRVKAGKYSFEGSDYELEICKLGENNSIHGFLAKSPMEVINEKATDESAELSLEYNHDGTAQGYPFPFKCIITFRLSDDEGLKLTTAITNTGKTNMPFGDGWHPYFKAPETIDALELEFTPEGKLETEGEGIPTGTVEAFPFFDELQAIGSTNLDDCFLLKDGQVILKYPELALSLNFWQEIGAGKYNHLQIYTPDDRKSIAIEPMTCEPNAFNTSGGLITITPGDRIKLSHGVKAVIDAQ